MADAEDLKEYHHVFLGINYTAWTGIMWTLGLLVQYNQPMSLFACMVPFVLDEFCAGILSNFSFFDRFDRVKQRLQTQDLAMIIQCCIITGLYAHAAWTMKRSRTTRWHSTTTSGHVAMLLHCASNVYELYLYGALGTLPPL